MAFSALEALQAFGMGREMAFQDRQRGRQEETYQRQEQTRLGVSDAVGAGNYRGAQQAALQGGEYELATRLGNLNEQDTERAFRQTYAGGQIGTQLRAIADPAARAAAFQQNVPMLRQIGFDDAHIQELGADLSDGAIDARLQQAQIALRILQPRSAQQQPTSFQQDLTAAGPAYAPGTPNYRRLLENRFAPPPRIIMGPNNQPMLVQGGGESGQPETQTPTSPEQLRAAAADAIARGADPAQVQAELQRMLGGVGPSADTRPANDPAPAFHSAPGGPGPQGPGTFR